MENYIKFIPSNSINYNNGLFASFHSAFLNHVDGMIREKLPVGKEVWQEYESLLSEVQTKIAGPRTDARALLMSHCDKRRNTNFRYVRDLLDTSLQAPEEEKKEAGRVLQIVFQPFRHAHLKPRAEKSTLISGLLLDLRKPQNIPYVATLQLEPALAALEAENNEYERLASERTHVRNLNPLSIKEIRRRMDELYELCCDFIYASQLLAATSDEREMFAYLIQKLNAVTMEHKSSQRRSKAQRSRNKEKDEQ